MIENLIIQNSYKKGRVNSLIYNSEIGYEYLFSLLRNNSIIALGFYYFDTSTSFQIVQNGIYKIKVTAKNIYSNETKDFFSDDFKQTQNCLLKNILLDNRLYLQFQNH